MNDADDIAAEAAGWLDEPPSTLREPLDLLLAYLDYYRDAAVRKIDGLTDGELRGSRLPSGWSPLALVQHLAFMERRWMQWGFAGEPVPAPWGDEDPVTEQWAVPADVTVVDVVANLRAVGLRTREIATGSTLGDVGRLGGRFSSDREPPTLAWILLHVLQEYARHLGHLDIARELTDGAVGE
jgi:hypothetical protein